MWDDLTDDARFLYEEGILRLNSRIRGRRDLRIADLFYDSDDYTPDSVLYIYGNKSMHLRTVKVNGMAADTVLGVRGYTEDEHISAVALVSYHNDKIGTFEAFGDIENLLLVNDEKAGEQYVYILSDYERRVLFRFMLLSDTCRANIADPK